MRRLGVDSWWAGDYRFDRSVFQSSGTEIAGDVHAGFHIICVPEPERALRAALNGAAEALQELADAWQTDPEWYRHRAGHAAAFARAGRHSGDGGGVVIEQGRAR